MEKQQDSTDSNCKPNDDDVEAARVSDLSKAATGASACSSPQPKQTHVAAKDSTARILGGIGAMSGLLSALVAVGALSLAIQSDVHSRKKEVAALANEAWDALGGGDYINRINDMANADLNHANSLLEQAEEGSPNSATVMNVRAAWEFASGRPQDAVSTLHAALRRHPDSHALLINLANIYRATGDVDEAVEFFERAKRFPAAEGDAYFGLGHIYLNNGQHDAAREAFEKARDRDPRDADAIFGLGLVSREERDFVSAISHFGEAVSIVPDHAEFRFTLGNTWMAYGNPTAAENVFRDTCTIDPTHWGAMSNLAILLTEAGNYPEAEKFLRDAIRVKPNAVTSHTNLATLLASQGRHDDAIQLLQTAIQFEPTAARYYNLGNSLHAAKRYLEAVSAYEECLKLDADFDLAVLNLAIARLALQPTNANAFRNLGDVHGERGNQVQAIEAYRRAYDLGASESEFIVKFVQMLLGTRAANEAHEIAKKAVLNAPSDSDLHNVFGIVLDVLGDKDGAIRELETVISLAPDDVRGYHNLANVFVSIARTKEAEQMLLHALSIDPEYVKSHTALGRLLADQERLDEALVHMKQAARFGETANTLNQLGVVYARLGQLDEACRVFRLSIQHDDRFIEAHNNLITALREGGLASEAAAHRRKYAFLELAR